MNLNAPRAEPNRPGIHSDSCSKNIVFFLSSIGVVVPLNLSFKGQREKKTFLRFFFFIVVEGSVS